METDDQIEVSEEVDYQIVFKIIFNVVVSFPLMRRDMFGSCNWRYELC